MKYILLCLALLATVKNGSSQGLFSRASGMSSKKSIELSDLATWPQVSKPAISNNGAYAYYTIENQPVGKYTLVIQNIKGDWKREAVNATAAFFSDDSKLVVYSHGDTVRILQTGTDNVKEIVNVRSFKWPKGIQKKWIAYELKGPDNDLVILDLAKDSARKYKYVKDYLFDDNANTALLRLEENNADSSIILLKWINLNNLDEKIIWFEKQDRKKEIIPSSHSFDATGKQLTFNVSRKTDSGVTNTIYYYKEGMAQAVSKVIDRSNGIMPGFFVKGAPQFSKNGLWIFFKLQRFETRPKPNTDIAKVNIWSYKDVILQPEQLRRLAEGPKTYLASISVNTGPVTQIELEGEEVKAGEMIATGDYLIVGGKFIDYWWNTSLQPITYLMSLKDGSRIALEQGNSYMHYSYSPSGRFIVFFDSRNGTYLSYDLRTKKVRNIAKDIPDYAKGTMHWWMAPVAGWLGDTTLLLHDEYDIWNVDPLGIKSSVNITNGYGRKHHLKLRLLVGREDYNVKIDGSKIKYLIVAFSPVNKYNGFFWKDISVKNDPEVANLEPAHFFHTGSQLDATNPNELDDGMRPLKANNANAWIVKRQTFDQAPNYFFTRDFKSYKQLTNLQPQSKYYWLTAELVSWKQLDGTMSQGVLYKPDNFDPKMKYPIIFNYYEQSSQRLYEFPYPKLTQATIDIAWFVSKGYLVFTPDIHYQTASKSNKTSGEWAYNSVVSAALFLSKRPYVDRAKMGIQGHSFGGGETNYLVTHSNVFAAAAEAAGISDPLSAYLTLIPLRSKIEHSSVQNQLEFNSPHFGAEYGASPWQRPDLYIRNSAVWNANKVTAPLLIMHNESDNNIQWRQAIEFYMALRRLGKKVWMLQYDDGDHAVYGKDALDYTIRLTQFFDHYLKGSAPPKWMTESVPASKKGIETYFELDKSGVIP